MPLRLHRQVRRIQPQSLPADHSAGKGSAELDVQCICEPAAERMPVQQLHVGLLQRADHGSSQLGQGNRHLRLLQCGRRLEPVHDQHLLHQNLLQLLHHQGEHQGGGHNLRHRPAHPHLRNAGSGIPPGPDSLHQGQGRRHLRRVR